MRSATGRWVSGEDYFDRERELAVLKTRVLEWNHVLLTGQRRMGLYSAIAADPSVRIADTLEVLIHDGYLESCAEGSRYPSRLLRDWWSARYRGHYVPLERRRTSDDPGGPVR